MLAAMDGQLETNMGNEKASRGFAVTRLESPLERIDDVLTLRDMLAPESAVGHEGPSAAHGNEEKLRKACENYDPERDIMLEMRRNDMVVGFLAARAEEYVLTITDFRIDASTDEEGVVENLLEELAVEAHDVRAERIEIEVPNRERHLIDALLAEGMHIASQEGGDTVRLSMGVE